MVLIWERWRSTSRRRPRAGCTRGCRSRCRRRPRGDRAALGGADGGAGRRRDVLPACGGRCAPRRRARDGAADRRGDLARAAPARGLHRRAGGGRGRRRGLRRRRRRAVGGRVGRSGVRRRTGGLRLGDVRFGVAVRVFTDAERSEPYRRRRRRRPAAAVVDGHEGLAAAADVGHVGLEERLPGLGVDAARHRQPVALLEASTAPLGDRPEDPVVVHTHLALDGGDRLARVPERDQGARRHRDRRLERHRLPPPTARRSRPKPAPRTATPPGPPPSSRSRPPRRPCAGPRACARPRLSRAGAVTGAGNAPRARNRSDRGYRVHRSGNDQT